MHPHLFRHSNRPSVAHTASHSLTQTLKLFASLNDGIGTASLCISWRRKRGFGKAKIRDHFRAGTLMSIGEREDRGTALTYITARHSGGRWLP